MIYIIDNLKMDFFMGKEFIIGKMKMNIIKVNIIIILKMEKDYICLRMEIFTKVIGIMVNLMERELMKLKIKYILEIGKMEILLK
jgi:hypothetical protein